MTDPNPYQAPAAQLVSKLTPKAPIFSSLSLGAKIILVLLIGVDLFSASLYFTGMMYGAREFGFVLAIIMFGLTAMSYRSVVERKLLHLWILVALHIIPGFNLVGAILAFVLTLLIRHELVLHGSHLS